jgi:rod shape determining protein RodA
MLSEKSLFIRIVSNIDWILMLSLIVLFTIGFGSIYSATYNYAVLKYVLVQGLAFIIGFVLMIIFAGFNYQNYEQMHKVIYILSLLLLISVLILGTTVRGTKGWFNFGFISFQPVEIAKILYILVLAAFLNKKAKESSSLKLLFYSFLLLGGHLFLIMLQPDFSSTLSYLPVTLILLFLVGVDPFYLICIIILGGFALGIPLINTFFNLQFEMIQTPTFVMQVYTFISSGHVILYIILGFVLVILSLWFLLRKLRIKISIIYPILLCLSIILGCIASIPIEKSLKGYQMKRLVVFLAPSVDRRGSGYNIIQSKIAIGSGKIVGKGFRKGTQTQLGFLPEQHTDFIFAVVGEEGGWFISQLVLFFYFLLIWRAMAISRDARDSYGSLVAVGIGTMFSFYAFVNIGMVLGIMPVTGMPLLLLSYGGSSVVSSMVAIGILSSIYMHRYTYYKTTIRIN